LGIGPHSSYYYVTPYYYSIILSIVLCVYRHFGIHYPELTNSAYSPSYVVSFSLLRSEILNDKHRCFHFHHFIERPFVKRFVPAPMLPDRCHVLYVCLSVCNVGVLWPNGWMDQDKTWHTGRTRPWPYCGVWGPSSPVLKGHSPHPNFRPISVAAKWLHRSRCHMVCRWASAQAILC